jgi:hypothetical protein
MRGITFLVLMSILALTPPSAVRAGEVFVKLDESGRELPDQAGDWTMVLDRASGLIWEIKRDDDSLHGRDNLYSWGEILKTFIAGLNGENFGGYSDWRLPAEKELGRLQSIKENEPTLFETFFPGTVPSTYWTWSRCQDGSKNSLRLKFGPQPSEQARKHRVRAVRGELRE